MHAELQSEAEAERRRKVRRGRKLLADRQTEMFDGGAWRQRDGLAAHRSGRALKGGGGEANTDDVPIEWLNPPFGSFDNFGSSMIILYIASTGDIWEEFLWAGMDARGAGIAPERNDSSAASAFFLAWMIVGAFISINLFVGAIVDNFTRIKKDSDGSATMTPEQQQWADAVRSMAANKAQKAAREPSWAPRRWVFMLVHSKGFEASVMTVIGLNVFGMALDYHKIEDDVSFHDNYVNGMMFFTYFYYAECITKLFALGHAYFNDNWCRFDFFLVCTSLLDQFASELLHSVLPMPPTLLRVLRVLRVLRILRLLKNLKGLRDLVFTLILAFPGLINVGALLLLVMFIYAVLGMNIFTFVMHGDVLNDNKNFETFGSACLVLFQCLTCDGWSEFMDDLLVDEHRGCDPNASPSDCGTPLSLPFFISWTVIGSFVFLNLIVAVILEHFTALGNVNPDLVSSNDIADFKDAWAAFDPDADGWIPAKSLPQLIRALKAPIGIGDTKDGATHAKAVKFCIRLGITSKDGQVQFREVLDALLNKNYAKNNIDLSMEDDEDDEEVAAAPELASPMKQALLVRRQSFSGAKAIQMGLVAATGASGGEPPLTPRRAETARVFAVEMMERWVVRKREEWKQNPMSHPSNRPRREPRRRSEAAIKVDEPAPPAKADAPAAPFKVVLPAAPTKAPAPASPNKAAAPAKPESARAAAQIKPGSFGPAAAAKAGSARASANAPRPGAPTPSKPTTGKPTTGKPTASGPSTGKPAASGERKAQGSASRDLPKPTSLPAPRPKDASRVDA
jgi:hypothetical protein